MKVNSTELQNNFGKYLMLAAQEDIIITRNGTEIAKLTALGDQLGSAVNQIHESVPLYGYGKKQPMRNFCNYGRSPMKDMSTLMGKFIFWQHLGQPINMLLRN